MEISSADQLRLNVLVAQPLQAVRIDESRMCIYALLEKGEAKVELNPVCKDEKYIRLIRQFLSSHYLGSPGGYPVYLRRWTRMGQARDDSLEKLLLIGEPEAVSAVAHATGLTNELARRAWWSGASAENARCMLEKENVVQGNMGVELAQFLVEFLPFEEQHKAIMDSVRLVLQPGLISNEMRNDLWSRGKRKNSYYVGFMQQTPHGLPIDIKPHKKWECLAKSLQTEISKGNDLAKQLCHTFGPIGQAFLYTICLVLQKHTDQDVVAALLNAIGRYFQEINQESPRWRDMQSLSIFADSVYAKNNAKVDSILAVDASLQPQLKALFGLSMIDETLVDPIFSTTDAIGSVMGKRIEPVVKPLSEYLHLLQP